VISELRRRLLAGEPLYGTVLSLPSPAVAEVLAGTGFDWLFVDGEHGPFDADELLAVLRAVGDTPCLVRVPSRDDAAIARALDAGAAGIIVPQVHDAAQAAHVAALARFPPAGTRGVGLARANGYGRLVREYLATANDAITVVVQAESAEAVENIESIARVPGVDAVLVGPNDLAASLGHLGDLDHPAVHGAIARIFDACGAAGRPMGIFGIDAEAVRPWVERGARLVVASADAVLLGAAARALQIALSALPRR
jgi:2-dehydro-3-deoxyglucarate aldolase/4-hydroxy-2-oxoheptanedioate aldolase